MSRIIFGSCTSQHYHHNQPLWPVIQNRNATAFVWGGDAVYADDRMERTGFFGKKRFIEASPDYLRYLLNKQRNVPSYRALLDTNISIFGTIDDHDYGTNNGDRTFRWKTENGIEFVKFLGLDKDSAMARRASNGLGVYGVQVYDFSRDDISQRPLTDLEAGLDPDVVPILSKTSDNNNNDNNNQNSNKLVAVFVLDVRTNKTPWPKSFRERFFSSSKRGDFLGEEQSKWFETAIGRSNAAVNIVVNGLPVHGDRYYDGNIIETWSNFPDAQHRLYQALLQPNIKNPILVTGDAHYAQLQQKDCRHSSRTKGIRPIYEVTTSGMTHAWGNTQSSTCGRKNSKALCRLWYYNNVMKLTIHAMHWLSPWKELIVDEATSKLQYSLDLNVAEFEFDWDRRIVVTNILGPNDGEILLHQTRSMDEMTIETSSLVIKNEEFDIIEQRLRDQSLLLDDKNDWICVHYRGIPNKVHFFLGIVTSLGLTFCMGMFPFYLLFYLGRKFWYRIYRGSRYKRKNH